MRLGFRQKGEGFLLPLQESECRRETHTRVEAEREGTLFSVSGTQGSGVKQLGALKDVSGSEIVGFFQLTPA